MKQTHPQDATASMIGNSPSMLALKGVLSRVAKTEITVLISGETGVGKELAADALHAGSLRKSGPFLKVNCAALPAELIESELFGYASGAFTGADRRGKQGRFEAANGGTILLDEIGEMPLELQAKLLRVLQERELNRVGSSETISVDVRVICATNQDLVSMVQKKLFRSDLYYRISAMDLNVPPLREHLEDLPALCGHFLPQINEKNRVSIEGIKDSVFSFLRQYHWPGNVRELFHVLERASVLVGGGTLVPTHFDFLRTRLRGEARETQAPSLPTLRQAREEAERKAILNALRFCGGNRSLAAKVLDIDRSALYGKLKRYAIEE